MGAKHGDRDSWKDCKDRRRGDNHDAVNTVRQKLNAFADALVKQVKILPDPFYEALALRGGAKPI